MTNTEMKKWRTIQIAATILYRICGKIRIEKLPNNYYYDLLVTLLEENESFGVKVTSSTYIETTAYRAYLAYLETRYHSNKDDFRPVLLMCVNEQAETAQLGIQIGWYYHRPLIIKKVKLHAATERLWPTFLDNINMMYNTIRSLVVNNNYIIKILSFEIQSPSSETEIVKTVYLRKFSEQYKIDRREPETDKERIETMLQVIRQDEYPQREPLDSLINKAIMYRFGNVSEKNSLLLFTSDLQNLRDETNLPHGSIKVEIHPKFDVAVLPYLNGMQLTSFSLPIYSVNQNVVNSLDGTICAVDHDLNDIIDYSSNIKNLLVTLRFPSDVLL